MKNKATNSRDEGGSVQRLVRLKFAIQDRIANCLAVLCGKGTVVYLDQSVSLDNPQFLASFWKSRRWKYGKLSLIHQLAYEKIRLEHPDWIEQEERRKRQGWRRLLARITTIFA
jgi:hypothetical protein